MADQYQAISEEEQSKAVAFFERGRSVAVTGNFDYAIEMFMQGLAIDPENVEAHQELRDISLKRKISGGKGLGMMERLKFKTTNKDDKLNMLNAERMLAFEPGDTGYMEGVLTNAHKGGFFDTVMWIGPILQKANAESKKPPAHRQPAVNIALRGPPSSTQRPNTAAEPPRNSIASEKIQPSSVSFQSPGADCVMPMSLVIGRLNTLSA